jgi:hypothetical protein
VEVKSDATDSSGRPAVEISRFEAWFEQEVEAFEDAKPGATLESAWVGPSVAPPAHRVDRQAAANNSYNVVKLTYIGACLEQAAAAEGTTG